MRLTAMSSMIDVLRDRAAAQPHDPAYVFLADGEYPEASTTWASVERRARAIGRAIQSRVAPESRVLVMCPPALEFVPAFFGVLYAGAIAVPAYPPSGSRADRTAARLRSMIADAGVSLVLAPLAITSRADALSAAIPEMAHLQWLAFEDVPDAWADDWRPPQITEASIAFLQYTSGSTATPRGVMVSHANLLHNLERTEREGRYTRESVSLSWLPVNHDMGLINGVLQPAFSGCRAYLMSPAAFLQRPARWLQAVSRLGATHSGAPNFAYDLCTRRVSPDERAGLDLSSWRVAYNGSEPVRRATLENFQRAFGISGFRWESFSPAYGLAESTLLVASIPAGVEPAFDGQAVASGVLDRESGIAIVDPVRLTRCAPGVIGEIWLRTSSVAAGYWNRDAESAATFRARITDAGDGPFLRSGDLGYILGDRLFVTGRIKDVLIVRGVKHYPQDLEATAERAHPAVRPGCCAAFAVDRNDEERIAIIAEVDPRADSLHGPAEGSDVLAALRVAVASTHHVSPSVVALVTAGTVPKTTSGKLQRYLCREALLTGSLDVVACWTDTAVAERAAS